MDHFRRIGLLRRRLTKAGLHGLLVTHLPDLRYLSGFTGSSAALAITRRSARLFTDGRYTAQAAEEVQDAQVEIVSSSPAVSAVQWLAAQPGVEFAGFDPARTTVADLARWRAALPSRLRRAFLSTLPAPMVEPLRLIKDDDELALMIEAALAGCKLFDHILGFIRPGIAEIDVAAELEHQARLLGAEGMSFDTIVASGVRSALPHGRATTARLPRQRLPDPRLRCYPQGLLLGYDPHCVPGYAQGHGARHLSGSAGGPGSGGGCGGRRGKLRRSGRGRAQTVAQGRVWQRLLPTPPATVSGWRFTSRRASAPGKQPGCYRAWLSPSSQGSTWLVEFGIRIEDMVAVTRTGGQVLTPAPKALIEL